MNAADNNEGERTIRQCCLGSVATLKFLKINGTVDVTGLAVIFSIGLNKFLNIF